MLACFEIGNAPLKHGEEQLVGAAIIGQWAGKGSVGREGNEEPFT